LNEYGTSILNWDGVNGSVETGINFNYSNIIKNSGNYSFKVYSNDTSGNSGVSETRVVVINLTNITPLPIDSSGNVSGRVNITSPSGNVTITIFNGTNATVNGSTITNITIDSPRTVPFALTDTNDRFIGENLTLGPNGTIFNPAIMINFSYNESQLAAAGNISASQLKVKYYNVTMGTWIELETSLNETEKLVTFLTTHFSTFALIGIATSASNPQLSSSSGGGGGGGGGARSGENISNIELIEKYDMQISKDALTSYRFIHVKNPIMFVNITGNTSLGIISASIEVLKDTSTLVTIPPEGLVYKNANIWVGTTGFALPKNIKEALIKFRINNAWISTNGVLDSDIILIKWSGARWIELETKVMAKDDTNTYFEGKTNSFSPFAIVAKTEKGQKSTATTSYPAKTPQITTTMTPEPTKNTPGFGIVLAFVGLMALVIRKRS
jgi:PGF-pre-PGF domain-containing protein